MFKIFFLLFILVFHGCGDDLKPESPSPVSTSISGNYFDLSSQNKDLSVLKGKVSVVFLASETCLTCIEEINEVKHYIKDKGEPSKVKLLTLLINSVAEDANFWKIDHEVNWEVGYTENTDLIEAYCPKIQTPCTLVLDKNNQILFSANGKVAPEKIESMGETKWW